MLISLSHQSVRGWARLSIETAHYVILHELQPLFVDFFVKHTSALVLDDVLEADDEDVWQFCRVSDSWQKPIAKVNLIVWLYTAHVPRAHCKLDMVYLW